MNVSISYKCYIHTHYENYSNVEWLKFTGENIKFKVGNSTHCYSVKQVVNLSVTQ